MWCNLPCRYPWNPSWQESIALLLPLDMWNEEAKGTFAPGGERPRPAPAVWDSTRHVWLLPGPLTTRLYFLPYSNVDRAWKKHFFFFFFLSFNLWGNGYTARCWDRRLWAGRESFPTHTHSAGPLPPFSTSSPGTRSPLNSSSRSWLRLAGVWVSVGRNSANERLRVPVLMQCLKLPSACLYPQDAGRIFWQSRESRLPHRTAHSLNISN